MPRQIKCKICSHFNAPARITCRKCFRFLSSIKSGADESGVKSFIKNNPLFAAFGLFFVVILSVLIYKTVEGYRKYDQYDSAARAEEWTKAQNGPSEPGFPPEKEIGEIIKHSDIALLLKDKMTTRDYFQGKLNGCNGSYPVSLPPDSTPIINPDGRRTTRPGYESWEYEAKKNSECKEVITNEMAKLDTAITCECGKTPATNNKKLFQFLGFNDLERYDKTQIVQDIKTENGFKIFRRIARCSCENGSQKAESEDFLIELRSDGWFMDNWKYSPNTRRLSSSELNIGY